MYLRFTTDADCYRGKRLLSRVQEWFARRRNNQVFLYIHFMEPHSPYSPPGKYKTLYDPDFTGTPVSMYPPLQNGKSVPVEKRVLQNMIAQYDGEIAYVDSLVGELFDYLKEENLYDPALIFLVADHGEAFYEHRTWGHHTVLYRELTKIPFIFKWPGKRYNGERIISPVELVDVKATILKSLGYESRGDESGDLILKLVQEPKDDASHDAAFAEDPSGRTSIRTKEWAYIEHRIENEIRGEFFLSTDTLEKRNLAKEKPGVANDLLRRLHTWEDNIRSHKIKPGEIPLDEERIQILKSLGYI